MKFISLLFLCCCCFERVLFGQDQLLTEPPQQERITPKELQSLSESDTKAIPKKSSPHKWTATIAFLSDYRSRGISQTFLKCAVQGEIKYTHDSGLYFKNWVSNVDGSSNYLNNTSSEWDIYLGYKRPLFNSDTAYDVGFLYYYYPGGQSNLPAGTSFDTLEYFISLQYKKLEFKVSVTLTDFFGTNSSNPPVNWNTLKLIRPNGHSYGSTYYEINYEYLLFPKWKASAHIGYQNVLNYEQLSYIDWLISLNREFEWFEVIVTYVQTNARKAFYNQFNHSFNAHRVALGGPGVVIAVDKSF